MAHGISPKWRAPGGPPKPAGPGAAPAAHPPTPAEQKKALATKLVSAGGSANQKDVDAVVKEVEKLPLPALQKLSDNNVKIVAVPRFGYRLRDRSERSSPARLAAGTKLRTMSPVPICRTRMPS